VHADGGLRQVELGGGAREAAVPRHHLERPHVRELEIHERKL